MVFNLKEKLRNKEAVVCVIGLGYIGLPLAEAFSKHLRGISYDVNVEKKLQTKKHGKWRRLLLPDADKTLNEGLIGKGLARSV